MKIQIFYRKTSNRLFNITILLFLLMLFYYIFEPKGDNKEAKNFPLELKAFSQGPESVNSK